MLAGNFDDLIKRIKTSAKAKTKPKRKSRKKKTLHKTKRLKKKLRLKKSKKKPTLAKPEENPIILPRPENNWEAWQTFNPGVVLIDNKVHFLYRAIGHDGISRLGYAVSSDGFTIDERPDYPAYQHEEGAGKFNIYSYLSGGSFGGAEDPRLVRIDEEDKLHITYTAFGNGMRVGLASIELDNFLNNHWKWSPPSLISPPGENHKNWLLFSGKVNGKYALLHSINPEIKIEYLDHLNFGENDHIKSNFEGTPKGKGVWEKFVRGAGAPPIKTRKGWLLFYHAMDEDRSKYKVGAMLLDLNDPTKVLYRAKGPVLEPDEPYENDGFKAGVVYVTGAIVKDENLMLYYGAADNYICVAFAPLKKFLRDLKETARPRLRRKRLRLRKA